MAILKINGGVSLCGNIAVSGSKNAALPIIFATLVTKGVSRISRVPDISDVRVALKIIEGVGAVVRRDGEKLYIDTRELSYKDSDPELVSKIRGSTYILGASLVRFGQCKLSDFGGCNFASRPIDLHIAAAEAFGAKKEGNILFGDRLSPAKILFPKKSVGATANALIMAAGISGESRLYGHAKEPHIMALIDFLRSAGAQIAVSEDEIKIIGGELRGGDTEIIGDMIEAGTYLAAGVVTNGRVGVLGCAVSDMAAYLSFLSSAGVNVKISDGQIFAERGRCVRYSELTAEPYPAYPTDLQPIAAPVLAVLGGGKIYDKVFPNRFGYLDKLASFGVKYKRGSGEAEIEYSRLHFGEADIPDLRGGAACLVAALATDGESRLHFPEILLRGYENLEQKLKKLGARIEFEY